MNVNLNAGQSLRDLAEQLGVSVEELQQHTDVQDAEAPVQVDQTIEIPDGFFRERDRDRRSTMAAVPKTTSHGGMNASMALNIEYQRTRLAGGMKLDEPPDPEEVEGLAEAKRAYLRFEADSNDLAIDLWAQLTHSKRIAIRAEAYACQAIALAQRNIIYGGSAQKCRVAALSAAKAALMADPKLSAAHLAMALGLRVGGSSADRVEAFGLVERAVELDPEDPNCWVELATLLLEGDDPENAQEAAAMALEIDGDGILALEIAGRLAFGAGDHQRAEELLERAVDLAPDFALAHARLGAVLNAAGRREEAQEALETAKSLTTRPEQQLLLQSVYASVGD